MKLIVLLALLSLSACGTKTQPPPQDSFFEPAKFDEYAPPEPNPAIGPDSAVDLSWWDVDKEVVLHPLETSLSDDPIFWDYEGIQRSFQPETSPGLLREISERVSASPRIRMIDINPVYSDLEVLARRQGVSLDTLSQQRWIALGAPFNEEQIHVFQVPTSSAQSNYTPPYVVYEVEDFVLLGSSQRLNIVLDPKSIREGVYGNIPTQFQALFDLPSKHAIATTVNFLYPSEQQALPADFFIGNTGHPPLSLTMAPINAHYSETFQEATLD